MNPARKARRFFYFTALRIRCRKFKESQGSVNVGDLDLFYTVRGPESGRPVLLLHGNGGSHRSLATQSLQLARAGYRVYSPDSRGQGANPALEEYHYADMAEDFYQFILKMGLDKPAVFGWSDGGINALLLEMAHPGVCGPMVVSGANLQPDCGPDFEEFKKWILSEGTPLAMMMLTEPDIDPSSLKAVKCPVLVTAGRKDLISPEHTALIAKSLPDSELVILEGEDHGSYIKKSPKIGALMLDFFKRHDYD